MNKGMLILFSGPSGSGKDTVLAELKKRSSNFVQSVSMTTRQMRDGEVDGKDYIFTDKSNFEKLISEGYFLEYVEYNGKYYGTPKPPIVEMMNSGVNVLLKIEVQGADKVRKAFDDVVSVFVAPPSLQVLADRLKGRGTESEEAFNERLNIARVELQRASEYDYVVINDDISRCVDDVLSIINSQSLRTENQKSFLENINRKEQ